ncbi:MAG: hypothetical protein A3F84_29495 [Candidatus Handelsmanbacteria bacterium RIFCSPLOWO2_12_FULL_64_10]|uniref:Uncharacterized protein n=1 Tax=Handelsmanbacteria sp. (strain RIFCSPLOWO2_12_FULL_64_10) TaxID=1817868 RepID=A0A1F6CHM9_HANXR|nr:MAG: hypothetical protein A3F84_29495 [Candidatus Handelsmanbacteria bacterium RIFCSPLOWO2_12_FULL_64_10]
MSKINVGRVIVSGLLAGVVLNVGEFVLNEPILGDQWTAAMAALNRPPIGGDMIAWFVLLTFVLGIALVWLYAAIRPRFGAGPKTAVWAGVTVWFFACLWGFGSTWVMGLFPARLVGIILVWELIEVPLAAVAGAWLYREAEPA